MKVKNIIIILIVLSVLLIGFIVTRTTVTNETKPFKTLVYKLNDGYGYSISYNDILFIKQDYIPTIQNNQSFCTYHDAEAVANLVLEKLIKKENPSITNSELKQLGIKLNCIN